MNLLKACNHVAAVARHADPASAATGAALLWCVATTHRLSGFVDRDVLREAEALSPEEWQRAMEELTLAVAGSGVMFKLHVILLLLEVHVDYTDC